MTLVRLLQPDGLPVYLDPYFITAVYPAGSATAVPSIGDAPARTIPHTIVAWILPSARDDRTHIGRMSLVAGSVEHVAKALGLLEGAK